MALAHDSLSESHTGGSPSTSEASFSWTHTPAGTPRSVLVFVVTFADVANVSSVTYGGVAMTAVSGGEAICTDGDEDGRCTAFHLGASIPSGAQTVTVNRTNNGTAMYATCHAATAGADSEVYTAGIVLQQSVGTLAEQNVDDGSPGANSLRYASLHSGLDAVPSTGANSTGTTSASIDVGARTAKTVYETTPGQGSRLVGFSSGTSDDRAAVYLAVRETSSSPSASGATTLPGLAAAASGLVQQAASGAVHFPHLRASGAASHRQSAVASAMLPHLRALGAATAPSANAGALALPSLAAHGIATALLVAGVVTAHIEVVPALAAAIDITHAVAGQPGLEH